MKCLRGALGVTIIDGIRNQDILQDKTIYTIIVY